MRCKASHFGGTTINLSGDEVATAIDAYLVARRVTVIGPRTIMLLDPDSGQATGGAQVYVDPSGKVIRKGRLIE